MNDIAFQDRYADDFSHCYGCGRLNQDGLQIKSYWDGDESVCHFTPKASHTGGVPGNVYGGLIASLIDCHGAATAAAAKARSITATDSGEPLPRFVTASMKINFLKPTPIDCVLEIRGRINEIKGRKVTVDVNITAKKTVCATGQVLMIQLEKDK